jgi:hypothetical protein
VGRLNHIAIAYKETETPAAFFKNILNMDVSEKKVLGDLTEECNPLGAA